MPLCKQYRPREAVTAGPVTVSDDAAVDLQLVIFSW